MAPTRRRALQATGATALAALAGCSTSELLGGGESPPEYSLQVTRIDATPVEYALYEPDDGALFGEPARTALDAILPDGRHTTYGYKPLPGDEYVAHRGSYYQTEHVVTGRKQVERQLVRVEPVPEDDVPDGAVLIDSLERPSARALKLLHSHTRSNGETSSADLLHGDAYVLRRPAEQTGALATGDLDGQVVTMTDSGAWAYRVRVTRERLTEPAHTATAVPVADSRSQFRDVVFGSRIDAELAPAAVGAEPRALLEEAINRGAYAEQTPISESLDALLDALGVGAVDSFVNGKLLWYDGDFYRYALYIDPADG